MVIDGVFLLVSRELMLVGIVKGLGVEWFNRKRNFKVYFCVLGVFVCGCVCGYVKSVRLIFKKGEVKRIVKEDNLKIRKGVLIMEKEVKKDKRRNLKEMSKIYTEKRSVK